jgi:hypothetical protein
LLGAVRTPATASWQDVLEVTDRAWAAEVYPDDDHLAFGGRVMEMLSEHQCQGWLEGYLQTGRHGFFSCYEAFIHIVDSMFNQHARWLKVCRHIPWRRPIAPLNYLLSSHVWRHDHNGFSHQDPGQADRAHALRRRARRGHAGDQRLTVGAGRAGGAAGGLDRGRQRPGWSCAPCSRPTRPTARTSGWSARPARAAR